MDLVCHMTKCSPTSMVQSVRIASFISNTLNLPLFHYDDQWEHFNQATANNALRRLILVNSPTGFASADMRWRVAELVHRSVETIFVQNDYKMKPPSQIKNYNEKTHEYTPGLSADYYGLHLWTAVPEAERGMLGRAAKRTYINWSELSYKPIPEAVQRGARKGGLVYWGAFRKGREPMFERYFNTDEYDVTISCPTVGRKKFLPHVGDGVQFEKPFRNLHEQLLGYNTTIYIQDKHSNTTYCSPGNRLYEALSAGVAVLVHWASAETLKKAGFVNVDDYVVRNAQEVGAKLLHAGQIAAKQHNEWHIDPNALTHRLREIANEPCIPQRRR